MDSKDKTPQTSKNKKFSQSLRHAFVGMKTAYTEERNLRVHFVLAVCAIILAFLFKFTRIEWLWLLLLIFCVFFAEMMNTVIENVVDLVTDKTFHPLAKKAKDMAAAGVLLAAILAVIGGVLLFLPKIIELF